MLLIADSTTLSQAFSGFPLRRKLDGSPSPPCTLQLGALPESDTGYHYYTCPNRVDRLEMTLYVQFEAWTNEG
jgi:hypothetical protein